MGIIAIIPARSGSKGVKDKNIKEICGHPLIYYSISAAKKSGIFDCIHVSTNSEKYREIARCLGADVPILRPESLGTDKTSTWDVVRWVLEYYKSNGYLFDTVVLLQPTSPLRDSKEIIGAYNFFIDKNADSVISVCKNGHPTALCNVLDETLSMYNFIQMDNARRRQDFKIEYRINGAIYIFKTNLLYTQFDLYNKNSYAYIMKESKSIDIDTELDFFVAEKLLENDLDKYY
ncbi:MAG: acylneuraminate cytidylyltransferase family protein [Lachnospiraceae bacterium]|nr:acylneuraminate cytidylyltransferase family protein [Lachnospiraceae bacterium]